ncbi:uncharacterized protein PV09_02141 [Verruconis gallopava]|uniref:Zinc finger CHCC-type domain-containing protein n=1 Tax=Verruconis gallopava TaxID=253628 RepID=A0A0D2B7S1_9PEZI|nr:uncharacterized protein PV09_02141 [Verruconis gallopava]KIW07289.1 hypothetical protein PV09_02141 [Verruconis gallopava]
MIPVLRTRTPALLRWAATRAYSAGVDHPPANDPKPATPVQNVSATNATPTSSKGAMDSPLVGLAAEEEKARTMQAPNRADIWSRSQRPRKEAMAGPRFEQTIMADQPRPLAAIELIHKQPVRWRHERVVSCDGGGGPLGHPRIFINLDKPQINECTYCGLPFANEHHRAEIEAQPNPPYPLTPTGDVAEVEESQRITSEPLGHR